MIRHCWNDIVKQIFKIELNSPLLGYDRWMHPYITDTDHNCENLIAWCGDN